MKKEIDFTNGPIVGPLLRFSLPILLALFLQALYGAVDLLVVGKYATAADVSGVAVGSQIMMTVTSLISSFAMGTTTPLLREQPITALYRCQKVFIILRKSLHGMNVPLTIAYLSSEPNAL